MIAVIQYGCELRTAFLILHCFFGNKLIWCWSQTPIFFNSVALLIVFVIRCECFPPPTTNHNYIATIKNSEPFSLKRIPRALWISSPLPTEHQISFNQFLWFKKIFCRNFCIYKYTCVCISMIYNVSPV